MEISKILVVDDEPDLQALIKQKFRKQIRENSYEFIFAENGVQALQQIEGHSDIEVILSDINMPKMDGLTLLSKINEQNLLLKSVIVSAFGDMENIRLAMNRGAFDFITKPINFADLTVTIEKTIEHVREMRRTMIALRENNILKMYVNETVLNFMGRGEPEQSFARNEMIEASVAFIDICEFTKISESESPHRVIQLLNSYFDVMVMEIVAKDGYIDKFIGDAIMAVFSGDDHLYRAIDACLAVRKRIKQIPRVEDRDFNLQVSIGINSGEMISGNVGSVELRRLDYTVIGDVVNIAQRLQTVAAPGQIIIDKKSFEKIKASFKCGNLGIVQLKNKSTLTEIYEVIE